MPEPHGSGMMLETMGPIGLLVMVGSSDSVSEQEITDPKVTEAVGQA